ncbi:hypothetical protein SESBI_22905 [Sesbania bispinosa]|nr:hypothetical protein SESBI_22905 [Sesbania bispinosa]
MATKHRERRRRIGGSAPANREGIPEEARRQQRRQTGGSTPTGVESHGFHVQRSSLEMQLSAAEIEKKWMTIERITLILHHRGSMLREKGVLKYVGGEMCVWEARKNQGEIEIFFIHPIEQTPTLSKPPAPHVASPLHTPLGSPIPEMSDDSDDYESDEDKEKCDEEYKKLVKGKGIAVGSNKRMKSPASRKRKGKACASGSGNVGTLIRAEPQVRPREENEVVDRRLKSLNTWMKMSFLNVKRVYKVVMLAIGILILRECQMNP